MNLPQFAKCHPLKSRVTPAVSAIENLLGLFIGKRADHA
jgi:hypothetical protein